MKTRPTIISTTISTALLALFLGGCGGDSPEKLLASSKEFMAKNDSKAAIIQLKNALQNDPNLGEARFLLGKALLESGDIAGAEVELRKARELKFADEQTLPLLAKAMLATGQYKKVIDEYGKITLPDGEPMASLKTTLSNAYAAQGNKEAAQTALAAALAAKPDFAPAMLADARQKAMTRDLDGANSIANRILDGNPRDHDALMLRGSLLATENKLDEAMAEYRKAIEARPDSVSAYSAIISIYLQSNKVAEAAKEIEALKKVAPKHPQTTYLDALTNFRQRNYKVARELLQQLLKFGPNNPNALQLAGAVEFQMGSYVQAEGYLTKALKIAPNLMFARRTLVANYLRTGQLPKALSTLQPVLDKIDQDSGFLMLAGETYLQNGNPEKAEAYFSKANKLDPTNASKKTSLALTHLAQGNTSAAMDELEQISLDDKGITADLALIAANLRSGQYDKAIKAIDALEKKQPNNPATQNIRARALLAKKDAAGARKSYEKALALSPTYFPSAAGLAALDLAEKKPDEAQKRFERILSADPKNVAALLALAELRANYGGSTQEVTDLIGKAIAANPGDLVARLALIQYHLQKKDTKKALAAANDAVAAMPDRPEILDSLGRTQRLAGDPNQALSTYGKLATLQPGSPTPHLRIAEIHLANNNKDEASKSLRKALEINPSFVEAQRGLVLLAAESGKSAEALAMSRQIQKQRPKEAIGYALEGDIHARSKSWPEAIGAYRAGLKQSSSNELLIKLHAVLLSSGNSVEAEKIAATWLKEHPKDVTVRVYLGDTATGRKEYAQAIQHYRSALEIQPNNALVLNNLAWTSGQLKSPKALEYAEKANQLAPDQPPFMDTLAMLLAEKGETAKAIELLRKALLIAPQAASLQLNLAKVLIEAGKKDDARKELEALAKLGNKFPNQAEVSQLLAKL